MMMVQQQSHCPRTGLERPMQIKCFNELDVSDFDALAKLDAGLVGKYGISFSGETWNAGNFSYDRLPKKFDLSYVLNFDESVAGYCVASEKHGSVYIHRFAVEGVEKGLAARFFETLLARYPRPVYLMVNSINAAAIGFYKRFGFETVCDAHAIRPYIAKGLEIEGHTIIIDKEKDYTCYLMVKN